MTAILKAIADRVVAGFGPPREVASSAYIQRLMACNAAADAARAYDDYVTYLQRQHDTQEDKTMTAIPIQRLPAAILTEQDILQQAAEALQESDRLQQALKANDATLRTLCRLYDKAGRTWGIQPHHLRRNCEAMGLL